jgi:NadR type nicotinamide-nucleotide adenylyltransferase
MPPLRKIVVIGPESTGKSTLSAALAAALGTSWNPEYARFYLDAIARPYTEEDLLLIARGQISGEDEHAIRAKGCLICDTDLYVLKVWSEAKYGACNRRILEMIATRPYDLYLLTCIDMPWIDDPQREHPLDEERQYFYHQYRDIVQHSGLPWADIRGTEEERLSAALAAIARLA